MIEHLRKYATSIRQYEILDAVTAHKTHRKAALALGINKSSVSEYINRLATRAAKRDPVEHQY